MMASAASVVLALFAFASLSADEVPALGCINEMAVPVYAGVIWQARIVGTATVKLSLRADGSPSEVHVESPHVSLTNWLTWWFMKTSFLPRCGGQTIQLAIKYRLQGEKRESPENEVTVKFPNTFEITAHPPILHQTIN